MEARKLENIIIVILLLLNLFLLSIVLADDAQARSSRRETVETAAALLEKAGIAVDKDAVLLQKAPRSCTVVRDLALEQSGMKAMLGDCYCADQGGNIWFYRSDAGQAVIRGTGEMDMIFSGGSAAIKGSPKKTAVKLFSRAGIELDGDGADETAGSMVLHCCWQGYPVYNAKLSFDFSEESLSMASGVMVFNSEASAADDSAMDSVSALMRFTEIVRNEGFICSRLQRLTPGYLMTVTVSGESTLTPVWHVLTDTGSLYINAQTGQTVSGVT